MTITARRLAPLLWLLLIAFAARVLGQALVAFGGVTWLPPMRAWMSGVMPYRYLLPSQVLILGLLGKVCVDVSRERGWGVGAHPRLRRGVLGLGLVYLAAMILRCVWFGWSIPVVFHWVLAAFLILFGLWRPERTP